MPNTVRKPRAEGIERALQESEARFRRVVESSPSAMVMIRGNDEAMRRMVVRVLVGGGHQVIEAPDGRDGMRLFLQQSPDIVVSDIVMPHRDGIETIAEIRAASPATGIIAMSGAGRERVGLYLAAAKQLGADAVLQKPFRPDELIAAVAHVLETPRAIAAAAPIAPSAPPLQRTAKILVIEDDEAMRRLNGRILTDGGCEVVEAADGRVGMRLFQEAAPCLVITDIVMPNRDGIEIIREIRESGSKVGIIAISGAGVRRGELFLSAARQFGADVILQKPFRPEALRAAVEVLLKRDLSAA